MLKVLVPTDFSVNSKAGMRFALQWSTQQRIDLIFLHVFHAAGLPGNEDYTRNIKTGEKNSINKLQRFVLGLYKSMHCKPGRYSCVAIHGISPDISILDYCRKHLDVSYICVATHGAGKINRLFGTNTGNLITKSQVPVIAVPKNYRKHFVKHILYATDLMNYPEELKKVKSFSRPLKANIKIVHLTPPEAMPGTPGKPLTKRFPYGRELKLVRIDITRSLISNLQDLVDNLKPSLIVMFTDQTRGLVERILFPSKAEHLSFTTKIPLLAFQKT